VGLLLYGANGYTGELIAREAVARGLRPTLSGRNAGAVGRLAAELNLPARPASLDDLEGLDAALAGHSVVLHCAGPFQHTFAPMVAACLRRRAHYLDITGEIPVFEALARRDADARTAGIALIPGVGFDVVPTDCLAAHLARRLPGATALTLAFRSTGGLSRGTALTMVEHLGGPGAVRREGRLVPVPPGWKTMRVDFGRGLRLCMTIPWGDVATAYRTTRIPDIEVYTAVTGGQLLFARGSRWLGPLLASRPVRRLAARLVRRRLTGPSAEVRRQARSVVWGRVRDADGREATARLHGPEGYTLTALAAVRAAERVLAGSVRPGYHTPAAAFGADFVLDLPGVTREDLDP
jgi:short subunit dehydrogenase-like uncharacterized protein